PSLSRQTLRPGNGLRFAIAHHPRYALPRGRITCTFPPRRGPAPRYPRSSPATRTTFPYRLVPEQNARPKARAKRRTKSPNETPTKSPKENPLLERRGTCHIFKSLTNTQSYGLF